MATKDKIRVGDYRREICPVCGKEFFPTPLHVYRLSSGGKKVCSYTCLLKGREGVTSKKGRVRYTVFCPDGYVAQSAAEAARHIGIEEGKVHSMIKTGKLKHEIHCNGKRSEAT